LKRMLERAPSPQVQTASRLTALTRQAGETCGQVYAGKSFTTLLFNSVALVHERAIPTERLSLVDVVPSIVGSGCRVVSATDPYGRRFLDHSRYFFLSSSSSIVLTRLREPRSVLVAPGIELGPLYL
jgi:hypothetical protein